MKNFPFKYKETSEVLKEIKVLIVDDDYLTTAALEMFLSPYIPNLISLNSSVNASCYLEYHHVDLLITDYWMSDLTGTDLIKIAKQYNPDICTILLTVEDKLPVVEIVNLGVDRYLKKPAMGHRLLEAIEYAVHRIILKKILLEKQKKEIELMKYKEKYHEYHEKEAFKKQLNIIRDELKDATFLNKIKVGDEIYYFKSFYKPREILSGDAYSVRLIGKNRVFIYVVDIMGKGLSSSVTAINSASILNYLLTKYSTSKTPIIRSVIERFIDFIKTILLDEEIVCAVFVEIDFDEKKLMYANFSMPPIFLVRNKELSIIKANNIPINKFIDLFRIDKFNIKDFDKIILLSDGIIEAKSTQGKVYFHELKENIISSKSMKEFLKNINITLAEIPDDVTVLFIKKIDFDGYFKKTFKIKSSLDDINKFTKEFCKRLERSTRFKNISKKIGVVLTELLLNAHEHGNLGITSKMKDIHIENQNYYESFVYEREKEINKFITITVVISLKNKNVYFCVEDEGTGFDRTLSNETQYSRFGFKIAEHLSDELFFNFNGNQSFFSLNYFDIMKNKLAENILTNKEAGQLVKVIQSGRQGVSDGCS